MAEPIKFIPVLDNGQVRGIAFGLALFSCFLVLSLFNHTPRYGGSLPMEFWLVPAILLLLSFTDATISKSEAGFLVYWRVFGFRLLKKQYEGVEGMLDGKHIYLVGVNIGQAKPLCVSFLKNRVANRLQELEINIVDLD